MKFLSTGSFFTHPMLASFLCGEFLLDIRRWLLLLHLVSFSYTSHAGLIFPWGISLTHPLLASFFCGNFLIQIPCGLLFLYFFKICFLFGEFLLHIPCWLYFYLGTFSYTAHVGFFFLLLHLGSFSYTSRDGFIFIWGFSYTSGALFFAFFFF